jgi:hypothetical protein
VPNNQTLSIALTMAVTFAVSFGIMWRQRDVHDVAVPRWESMPIAQSVAQEPVPTPPPLVERKIPVVSPKIEPTRVHPAASAPNLSESASTGALPVTIHIWNRFSEHKIEVAVQNISPRPMTVTARVESAGTQQVSEIQLALDPGAQKSFNSDNGLEMHSRDQITFQSPPYQDQVKRIP